MKDDSELTNCPTLQLAISAVCLYLVNFIQENRILQYNVQDKDMEKAKQLSTWDSAKYLKFIESDKLKAQRFETGEVKVLDQSAEVATILYGGNNGEVQIPVRTILIRVDNSWRVDVQKTMGSMVSGAMGAVVDELNTFMHESLKGVDQALSKGIGELGKSLEQGLKQLQQDLKDQGQTAEQSDQAI
jgi:hypothetical protein